MATDLKTVVELFCCLPMRDMINIQHVCCYSFLSLHKISKTLILMLSTHSRASCEANNKD